MKNLDWQESLSTCCFALLRDPAFCCLLSCPSGKVSGFVASLNTALLPVWKISGFVASLNTALLPV